MKSAKKTHWLRLTICVLAACAVAGVIIAAVMFLNNPGRTGVSGTVQFSFDGAAKGLAPNGYKFTIDGISSDEVLDSALADAGMADRYTADRIRDCLEAKGVYPENVVAQMTSYDSRLDFSSSRALTISSYHPTLFSVSLYNEFDKNISKGDLEKLLKSILASFRTWFAEEYAVGANAIAVSFLQDEDDYPQQLTVLTQQIRESSAYAKELYKKHPKVELIGEDGKKTGFNDIAVRLDTLADSDIVRLNASITINMLTKNPTRLITLYNYKISSLTTEMEKNSDMLKQLDKMVKDYDRNGHVYLAASGNVQKIDSNSTATYDTLVAKQKAASDEIARISAEIATYQQRLADINLEKTNSPVTGTSTGEEGEISELTQEEIEALAAAAEEASKANVAQLQDDMAALLSAREDIMKDFAALIKQYNDEELNDATITVSKVKYSTPSLLSGAFIKQALKVAGPLCAVGFMVCLVLLIISRRKEEKALETK